MKKQILVVLTLVGFIVTNELHSSQHCFRIKDGIEDRCYIVDESGFIIFGPKRHAAQNFSEIQNLLKIQKEKDRADAIQKKAFENARMTSKAYYAKKREREQNK